MRVEYSRRDDGLYNLWRLEPLFPPNEMNRARFLGVPEEQLNFWNLVAVEKDYQALRPLMRSLKNAKS